MVFEHSMNTEGLTRVDQFQQPSAMATKNKNFGTAVVSLKLYVQ